MLLGIFLLVAAALKIHGLITDPYGQENFLALPWLQVLTIEVEVLLGLALLFLPSPHEEGPRARSFPPSPHRGEGSGVRGLNLSGLIWYATLLFFTTLAAISFTLAYQGQTSCGCFGKVEINPWYTFALDVTIVVVMLCLSPIPWSRINKPSPLSWHGGNTPSPLSLPGRGAGGEGFLPSAATNIPLSIPRRGVRGEASLPLSPGGRGVRGEGESRATPLRSLFQILFTTSVLLGLLALGFTLFTKDPWATLARLRGETLAVLPPVTNLGQGTAGEQRTFQIQLHNYSDKPIKVVGGTTTCSCIATQDLPITIPAGGTESINVKIKFSGSPGRFAHRFVLYSDSDERLTVARFSGSVTLRSPVAGEKSRVTQALPSPLAGERPGVSQALPSPLAGEESGVRGE